MMNRNEHIMTGVMNHLEDAMKLYPNNVLAICLQGSQNYELDIYTPEYTSDIDTKCILLPSFEKFCCNTSSISHTHERANKEHIDFKDIRVMFDVFKKQNVNFVEILFTDYFLVPVEWAAEVKELRNLGEELVHAHPAQTLRTMSGMSMEKRKALCHPYPSIVEKIQKYGYDGKQLHHIIRIQDFMKRYIAGESFKACLIPSAETISLLMDAKLNKIPLEDAIALADMYDTCNRKMKEHYIETYGDVVNSKTYNKLDELKVEILKKHFRKELNV